MNRAMKAALLSFFFTLCATAALVTHRLHATPPTPLPRELFSVVSEQLSAIRHANFAGAYSHATSDVQQKFTLPQFERMLRAQYAELGANGHVEFGRANFNGSIAFVDVLLTGADGGSESFQFTLAAEADAWKIAGVRPLQRSSRSQRVIGLRL